MSVHDVGRDEAARAWRYGVTTLPAVVIDGALAPCRQPVGPNLDALIAAGLGQGG